jgi:Sec-independent protein translocase protein TatA
MKEENKLIDAILDLGLGMKALRDEMKGMRKDMNQRFEKMDQRFEKMEKEQHKTNLLLAEHSRSILTLADKLKVVVDHERRIAKLERAA